MTSHPDPQRLLEINVEADRVHYIATADGKSLPVEGPATQALHDFEERAAGVRQSPAGADAERELLRDFVARACVPALEQALRSTRVRTSPFLFLHVSDEALARLPWEALPAILELPDTMAVRVSHTQVENGEPAAKPSPEKERLLLVTSPRHAGRTLPGLASEAGDVAREAAAAGLGVTTMVEPTAGDVLRSLTDLRPQRLHLSVASMDRTSGDERLRVGLDSGAPAWLRLPDLCDTLRSAPVESAVVVVRDSLLVCGALCAAGARAALGWSGWVDDEQMRRFSLFFYQRLFEGCSPAAAVRLYFATVLRRGADRISGTPVVWLRAPDLTPLGSTSRRWSRGGSESARGDEELVRGDGPRSLGRPLSAAAAPASAAAASGGIQIEVSARSALNPALIKNGRPAIDHLVITSDLPRSCVRLSIVCDTGFSQSTYVRQISLMAGTQQVMTEDACFPSLHELLARDGSRRPVNFVVTLQERDTPRVLAETTRALLCMGGREWIDHADSWAYLPAFVLPYDRGTREVVSKARETLRVLRRGTDDFLAYYANDPADVDRQAEALFKTLQTTYGIRYMPPPGLGVYDPAAGKRAGQFVRLPEDILEHRWGTCHDLALLFAGCLEHIGIRPLVLMTVNHTFAGYWRGTRAHIEYWQSRAARPAGGPPGSDWLIHDAADIADLLRSRAITLVETTHATEQDRSYADATSAQVDASNEAAPRLRAASFQVAVDVRASRAMIQPL